MALEPLWTGSELLHKLLSDYLSNRIDTRLFCDNFETAYNFDVPRLELTEVEVDAFGRLFNEVVFYSSLQEELARIPIYRSEDQIRHAARIAATTLGQGGK